MNRILRRYVPSHFRQPWRLAGRLLKTRDPAAIYAMSLAAAGVAVSPLDFCLSLLEPRGNDDPEPSTGPLLFVCGGPRVGTTLVCQTLVRHLPVSHFTNLTSLFPAAPLTATRLFARFLSEPVSEYRSFYGRTTRLSGLNDALYLWDRWLGADRLDASPTLGPSTADEMRRFFASWRDLTERPLAAKCNRLNAAAHLVAEALPEATFICVEREPTWHAQSLLQARKMINGAVGSPYGLTSPAAANGDDPVAGVVEQVQFHAQLAATQEERIGRDRFWRVSYEDFCREPATLVKRAAETLWEGPERPEIDREIQPHRAANRRTLDTETFAKIEELLSAGQSPTN